MEEQLKFDKIGCWVGKSAILDPNKAVRDAKRAGVNHLDIMVNDATSNKNFHLFADSKTVLRSLKTIKDAGLTFSITSWLVPTDNWINGMENELLPILSELDIEELTLDVEEPYLIPLRKNVKLADFWSERARLAITTKYKGRVAVTCIVYTNLDLVEPLLKWCDVIIPQSYATVGNTKGLHAGDLERLAYRKFAKYNKKIVLGAAAWNIDGAYGLNEKDALKASFNAILGCDVYQVRIWSLRFIDQTIAEIIKLYL